MRKILLLLAAVGMIFTACTPGGGLDDDNNGNNTEQPGGGNQGGGDIPADAYIGLNKDAVTISPDGGSVDVTVYSNYKWTLSTSCDWCTASMSGGEANKDGVVVTLSADVAYDDREATFLFSCGNAKKVLIVSQKFKETIIADENNTFNVPAEGGVVEISYQTTVECEIVIPQNAQSWISITPQTRALISEKATLTIAENTTYSSRESVVKVVKVGDNTLFAEYTISQVQNDAIIAENNTLNIGGWQQNATIKYQTNVECEVVIPDNCKEWISVVPATRALSKNSVTLDFADNNTGTERNGVVQVVAVNNKELVAEYSVTQNQRYFIEYTTNDGNTITPQLSGIAANRYENGVGYIDFTESITSIGSDAFSGCSSLTSITIPDSVTEIGHKAFNKCSSLTAFYGKYASVDNRFLIIDGVLNSFAPAGLTEYIIPDSVTSIGSYAFTGLTSLKSLTIPESVTSIEEYAFSGYTGGLIINSKIIETDYTYSNCPYRFDWFSGAKCTLTIGDNITKIGNYTFYYCNSLTSVTIPDSVTTIGESTFYYCSSLTSVTIPDSVTSIGRSAFCGCTKLTSITIPDSVTSIGKSAFEGCIGELIINSKELVKTDYTPSNRPMNSSNGWLYGSKFTKLTIGDSVTSIGKYTFYNCTSLKSVTIGNSVTSIGGSAFSYCSSLTSVTIGNSVTSIGIYAFSGCTSLKSITIPDSVTSIGNYAFNGCSSLTSVTIPDSVTKIGDNAFSGCTSLARVDISDLSAWCEISFHGSSANPLSNGAKLYLNGSELTDITIPSDITEIKYYAFYYCRSLTSVTIPNSVTSIGWYAFEGCESLTSVTIGNSVTSIGGYAFYDCTSLTSVTIGNSVRMVGSYAFNTCSSLTSVTIPNSVTSIGSGAFYDCASLKEVYCKVTTPPAIHYSTSLSVFPFNSGIKIYVPRHSYDAYMQYDSSSPGAYEQTNWYLYKSYIEPYDFE